MGTMISDVKASVALTSTGQMQGYIAGSAANLGPVRLVSINGQASAADLEIKIYDGTSASDQTKSLTTDTSVGSLTGHIRVNVNGTDYWIPFYATN